MSSTAPVDLSAELAIAHETLAQLALQVAARDRQIVLLERLLSDAIEELRTTLAQLVHMAEGLERLAVPPVPAADLPPPSCTPLVPWPPSRPRYNGSSTPCDMWTGPCCCGATHVEGV